MEMRGQNRSILKKKSPNATSPITTSTWTDLGLKSVFHIEARDKLSEPLHGHDTFCSYLTTLSANYHA